MKNSIHSDIFDYYMINKDNNLKKNQRFKSNLRKYIREHFNSKYENTTWDSLSDTDKKDFILSLNSHIKEIIKKSASDPKKLNKEIEKKMQQDYHLAFEQRQEIASHNDRISVLYKDFYSETASEDENRNSFDELLKYHSIFFPNETPPTFEEWINNPIRLLEMGDAYLHDNERDIFDDSNSSVVVSKTQITDEVIKCILKELGIKIDIEGIKHCLTVTRNIEYLNYEKIDYSNPKEQEIAKCLLRLKKHDFIIYDDVQE